MTVVGILNEGSLMVYDVYDGDPLLRRGELVSRACRHVICA